MKYYRNPNPPRTGNPRAGHFLGEASRMSVDQLAEELSEFGSGLPRGFSLYSSGDSGRYLLVCSIPRLSIGSFGPDAYYYDAIELSPKSRVGDGSEIHSRAAQDHPFGADGLQKPDSGTRMGWYLPRNISMLSPNMREVADLFVNSILDEIAVDPQRRANNARDVFRRAMGGASGNYLGASDAAFDALYNTRDRNPRTRNPGADEASVAPATRGYLLLVEEAERIGMPERYKRDLYVHDRNVLGNQAMLGGSDDPPFVSLLRPSGSEVVALAPYRTNPDTLLSHGSITGLLHSWEEGCVYYHYTGKTLQRLSDASAVARVLGKWLNIHGSNPDKKILENAVSEHTPGFISVTYSQNRFGIVTTYAVSKSGMDRLRGYRLAYEGTDKQAALSAARNTPGVQLDFVFSNTPDNLDDYQFVPFDVAFGHGAGRTGNPGTKSNFDKIRELAVSLSQPFNSTGRYSTFSGKMMRLSQAVNKAAYDLRYDLDGGLAWPGRIRGLISAVEAFEDYIVENKASFSRVSMPQYSDVDALRAAVAMLRPYAQSGISNPVLRLGEPMPPGE